MPSQEVTGGGQGGGIQLLTTQLPLITSAREATGDSTEYTLHAFTVATYYNVHLLPTSSILDRGAIGQVCQLWIWSHATTEWKSNLRS